MATSNITNTITDGSGTAISGVTVIARLMGGGFRTSDSSEVIGYETTTSASDGSWTLTLERNANISPTGTWWQVEEQVPASSGGPRVWAASVGASNSTLYAALVTPSSSTGLASYITLASGDARYARLGDADGSNFVAVTDVSYGALGDGSNDDTAEIQAALDAVSGFGGGIVFFPEGTYKISSTLTVNSNVTLMGVGYSSIIQSSVSGTDGFSFVQNTGWASSTAKSHIGVFNLHFKRTNDMAGNEGPYDGALIFKKVSHLRIKDVWCTGSITGATLEGCTNFDIDHMVGLSVADPTVRVVFHADATSAKGGIVRNCVSVNSGYLLDGTTVVPEPDGPLGSGYICTQSNVKWVDNIAVNPRYNSIETGGAASDITVDGMHVYVNTSGRVGNILFADIVKSRVINAQLEVSGGGKARVYVTGGVGQSQTYIFIDGVIGTNTDTTAAATYEGVHVSDRSTFVTVRNCEFTRMRINVGSATSCADILVENNKVHLAPTSGFSAVLSDRVTLRNNQAFNCGQDTAATGVQRSGFVIDSLGSAALMEGNISKDTGAGTQLYGYYIDDSTIEWENNRAAGNVTAATTTTGSVTLNGRSAVAITGSAITQTYSTATATHSNMTSSDVVTTAAATTAYGYTEAQANAIVAAINALRVDVINAKGVLNQVIDTLQTRGLLG